MNVASTPIRHPEEAQQKHQWEMKTIAKGAPALIEIQVEKYTAGPLFLSIHV